MILTGQERFFVERRRRLTRTWPLIGGLLLVAILALAGWLLWSDPLLINPWDVYSGLKAGTIPESTLSLMAFLLPIAMLLCLTILCVLLLLTFVTFSNERKHLAIIDRLNGIEGAAPGTGHKTD